MSRGREQRETPPALHYPLARAAWQRLYHIQDVKSLGRAGVIKQKEIMAPVGAENGGEGPCDGKQQLWLSLTQRQM